jgi:hypothetical protein
MYSIAEISSIINIHNINNNLLDKNDLDEYLKNNEKGKDNEVDFSLNKTTTNCLF